METVVKSFIGIFFTLLLVAIGVGVISSSICSRNADSFTADCISKILSSNYSSSVIDGCKQDAADENYELTVDLYSPEGGNTVRYGQATLKYTYSIGILNISQDHYIKADIL